MFFFFIAVKIGCLWMLTIIFGSIIAMNSKYKFREEDKKPAKQNKKRVSKFQPVGQHDFFLDMSLFPPMTEGKPENHLIIIISKLIIHPSFAPNFSSFNFLFLPKNLLVNLKPSSRQNFLFFLLLFYFLLISCSGL